MGVIRINLVTFLLLSLALHLCTAIQIITPTQYINDSQTVTSADQVFKLGFFSPANSSNRYVGIWYDKIPIQTVVWVANRENPLTDSSGVFTIGDDGNLVVLDGGKKLLWSTNVSDIAYNSSAELSVSGNLILREDNSGSILWRSFDHPSHLLIPGVRISTNQITGAKQVLTSWKSDSDPSYGSFSVELDTVSVPQFVALNGSRRYWRSGPWNNRVFIGVQGMQSAYHNGFDLVPDGQDGSVYITLSRSNKSAYVKIDSQGKFIERDWDEGKNQWVERCSVPSTECEVYGKCGPFGSCNVLKSPICSCLKGFLPKSIEEWGKGNWSGGCLRRTQLQCDRNSTNGEKGKADGFLKLGRMKVPDFVKFSANPRDLKDCREECLKNCSCITYSYDSGIGCMWWSTDLIDIEKFSIDGVDLYIRLAHSELEKTNAKIIIIITVVLGLVIIGVGVCTYYFWRRKAKQRRGKKKKDIDLFSNEANNSRQVADSMVLRDNPELQICNFETLAIATSDFDFRNRLGQGGFGPVYKGKLPNGQEIAVKRLSKSSGQGMEEFKNEVAVISKLQHRNLVRLLGCCIEGEEKMLVYEYMPNKSLDSFIFDPTKRALLDWRKRLQIVEGIGRGILYLHRDSRLRIIHRDLKASNILLDEDLNPKISDFGIARIFGGNELQANTRRVVGTYGYMSPEYATRGLFSEKSDVFSFGVLLLEIVSGRRNSSFHNKENSWSLLVYAWKLWKEGEGLIDSTLSEPSYTEEILRCIHVGLLCVQELAKDRPTMSSIISMLTSEITNLPTPKQPACTGREITSCSDSSPESHKTCSINDVTITDFDGR